MYPHRWIFWISWPKVFSAQAEIILQKPLARTLVPGADSHHGKTHNHEKDNIIVGINGHSCGLMPEIWNSPSGFGAVYRNHWVIRISDQDLDDTGEVCHMVAEWSSCHLPGQLPRWRIQGGRCKCRHIFLECFITWIRSSDKSFGCDVMKRMRCKPSIFSTSCKSCANVIGSSRFLP